MQFKAVNKMLLLAALMSAPFSNGELMLRGTDSESGFEVPLIQHMNVKTNSGEELSDGLSENCKKYKFKNDCNQKVKFDYKYYTGSDWKFEQNKSVNKDGTFTTSSACRNNFLMKAKKDNGDEVIGGSMCSRGDCGFDWIYADKTSDKDTFRFCKDESGERNDNDDDNNSRNDDDDDDNNNDDDEDDDNNSRNDDEDDDDNKDRIELTNKCGRDIEVSYEWYDDGSWRKKNKIEIKDNKKYETPQMDKDYIRKVKWYRESNGNKEGDCEEIDDDFKLCNDKCDD